MLLFHQIFVEWNEAGVNLELGSLVEEADMCTIFRLLPFQLSGLPDILDVEVFFAHWQILIESFDTSEQKLNLLLTTRDDFVPHIFIDIDGDTSDELLRFGEGALCRLLPDQCAVELLLMVALDLCILLITSATLRDRSLNLLTKHTVDFLGIFLDSFIKLRILFFELG